MTQWPDNSPPGPQPPGPLAQGAGTGPQQVPYGARPDHGPGQKLPREAGAQWTCVVLLVAALIGCFIAGHSISGIDSSQSAGPVSPPTGYGTGIAGSSGTDDSGTGGSGTGGSGGSSAPTARSTPADPGRALARAFPIYPGSKRIGYDKNLLGPGGTSNKYGKHYLVNRSPTSVYRWYYNHLAHSPTYTWSPQNVTDSETHKIIASYGTVTSPKASSLNGELTIQSGKRSGICIIEVTLYG